MFFTKNMNRRNAYLISCVVIIIILSWIYFNSTKKSNDFEEVVKVAIREVGHQLLLSNQDSTSLVLPVSIVNQSKFSLSIDNTLFFEPNTLVNIVQKSFEKASLSDHYRVEVIQCLDKEVAYSYEMKHNKEKAIIPCSGRMLPDACYVIQFRFFNPTTSLFYIKSVLYFLLLAFFVLLFFDNKKRKQNVIETENSQKLLALGSFHFYPEQNKLIKEAVEINLSKIECELLSIFIAKPNQIIKRDELTKRVWEDKGVIVGRSLDTYISKLRKILKDDTSIKLTNVHGVGYKLEIN